MKSLFLFIYIYHEKKLVLGSSNLSTNYSTLQLCVAAINECHYFLGFDGHREFHGVWRIQPHNRVHSKSPILPPAPDPYLLPLFPLHQFCCFPSCQTRTITTIICNFFNFLFTIKVQAIYFELHCKHDPFSLFALEWKIMSYSSSLGC